MKLAVKMLIILTVVQTSALQGYSQNLLDMQSWTVGQGSTDVFSILGTNAENFREWGEGPGGKRAVLWRAKPDGGSDPDGGWNTAPFSIVHFNMYRFSVWLKKTNSNYGTSFFGCTNVLNLDNAVNDNPYFWYGDLPELNKWYLLVGYVHGSGDNSSVSYGGIYDGISGTKVANIQDFKFSTTATTTIHRSYLYYDPTTDDEQFFYAPRVEVVNGNEPSISTLIGQSLASDPIYFSGNVGIGNANPQYPLDITGKLFVRGTGTSHTNPNAGDLHVGYGMAYPGTSGSISRIAIQPYGHTGGPWKLIARDDNENAYLDINYGNSNALTINNSGNIGIGTEFPSDKLAVKGKIRAQEIKVEATPWPDYVFSKSYQLPTLQETEKHIKEKGHLSGIPSAEEVKANGIDLGEMNAKLLQKIEELTLHLIEKDKRDSAQQLEIEQLQKQIALILTKENRRSKH